MGLRDILDAATPGPWIVGDVWSHCGVMPERFGEGKCVHCQNIGTEPVWVGRMDINGTVMLAHRHRSEPWEGEQHYISGAEGTLVCGNYDYEEGGVVRDEDTRLIALAPELAALALDMGEFIRNVCDTTNEWESSLLARLDQLGKEQT